MKKLLTLIILASIVVPIVSGDKQDPFLEISKGNTPGHSRIHKFGNNEDVGGTLEAIWSLGGVYNFTTIAQIMNVSSTDVDDVVGDTGAWNITLFGLDANYLRINESVQLAGQTPVSTVNSYLRVYRAYVRKSGSSNANEGIIYIGPGATVAGVNANPLAAIPILYGQTMMAIYTVPANCTGYLETFTVSTYGKDKEIEVYLVVNPFNESARRIEEYHLAIIEFQNFYVPPRPIPSRTDIYVIGDVDVGAAHITATLDIVLVEDGFEVIQDDQLGANNMLLYIIIAVLALIAIGSNMRKR